MLLLKNKFTALSPHLAALGLVEQLSIFFSWFYKVMLVSVFICEMKASGGLPLLFLSSIIPSLPYQASQVLIFPYMLYFFIFDIYSFGALLWFSWSRLHMSVFIFLLFIFMLKIYCIMIYKALFNLIFYTINTKLYYN